MDENKIESENSELSEELLEEITGGEEHVLREPEGLNPHPPKIT